MLHRHGLRPWEVDRLHPRFIAWLGPVTAVHDELAALRARARAEQEAR
jgi:hypothetical protein